MRVLIACFTSTFVCAAFQYARHASSCASVYLLLRFRLGCRRSTFFPTARRRNERIHTMGSRVKKYRMKAIPSTFSEKGGFNAQFIGDGYSVDARAEILPSVITASGVQVGEGTAWDLVTSSLSERSSHCVVIVEINRPRIGGGLV